MTENQRNQMRSNLAAFLQARGYTLDYLRTLSPQEYAKVAADYRTFETNETNGD